MKTYSLIFFGFLLVYVEPMSALAQQASLAYKLPQGHCVSDCVVIVIPTADSKGGDFNNEGEQQFLQAAASGGKLVTVEFSTQRQEPNLISISNNQIYFFLIWEETTRKAFASVGGISEKPGFHKLDSKLLEEIPFSEIRDSEQWLIEIARKSAEAYFVSKKTPTAILEPPSTDLDTEESRSWHDILSLPLWIVVGVVVIGLIIYLIYFRNRKPALKSVPSAKAREQAGGFRIGGENAAFARNTEDYEQQLREREDEIRGLQKQVRHLTEQLEEARKERLPTSSNAPSHFSNQGSPREYSPEAKTVQTDITKIFVDWCRESGGHMPRFTYFESYLLERQPLAKPKQIFRDRNSRSPIFGDNLQGIQDHAEYWLVNYDGAHLLFPHPHTPTKFRETEVFDGMASPNNITSITPCRVEPSGSGQYVIRSGGRLSS